MQYSDFQKRISKYIWTEEEQEIQIWIILVGHSIKVFEYIHFWVITETIEMGKLFKKKTFLIGQEWSTHGKIGGTG